MVRTYDTPYICGRSLFRRVKIRSYRTELFLRNCNWKGHKPELFFKGGY